MTFYLLSAVEQLFTAYEVTDIIIIVFLVALAVKEVINLIDWFKNRGKNKFQAEETLQAQQEQIQEILKSQSKQNAEIQDIKRCMEILIISDKNDIKAWITEKYHEIMKRGWVDDYELDCLERRYLDYKQEGGNSYIEDLMEDIRRLPKTSRTKK